MTKCSVTEYFADMTQTDSPTDQAAAEVARVTGHSRYCAWHAVMSYDENWGDSQAEDPTAEWCKGDPTVAQLIEGGRDLVGDMCRCEDDPNR